MARETFLTWECIITEEHEMGTRFGVSVAPGEKCIVYTPQGGVQAVLVRPHERVYPPLIFQSPELEDLGGAVARRFDLDRDGAIVFTKELAEVYAKNVTFRIPELQGGWSSLYNVRVHVVRAPNGGIGIVVLLSSIPAGPAKVGPPAWNLVLSDFLGQD